MGQGANGEQSRIDHLLSVIKRPFRSRKSTSTAISQASSAVLLEAQKGQPPQSISSEGENAKASQQGPEPAQHLDQAAVQTKSPGLGHTQSVPPNKASRPVKPDGAIPAPVVPAVVAPGNDKAQVVPPAARITSSVANQVAAISTPSGNIAAIASPDGRHHPVQAATLPSLIVPPDPTQAAVTSAPPANAAAAAPPAGGHVPVDADLPLGQIANAAPNQVAASLAPPVQPAAALQSKKATKWNEALKTFKQTKPELFNELEGKVNHLIQRNRGQKIAFSDLTVPESIADKPQSHEVVQRMKRWLPSLAAVKTAVMPIAALDPHKIAPICCGLVFGIAEFVSSSPNPEYLNKTLDVYFEGINSINEWISFETNYATKISPDTKGLSELKDGLPSLYLQALELVAQVQHACNRSESDLKWDRTKARFAKLSNEVAKWDTQVIRLKLYRSSLATKRKIVEDTVATQGNVAEVLQWIRDPEDPEQTLRDIETKVTSNGRHIDSGQWFLGSKDFKAWINGFRLHDGEKESKRVLWLNGSYGTGKTTVIYRTYSTLKELADIQPSNERLRIISYFFPVRTSTDLAPSFKVLIRSIAQKLAFKPDFSVAQPAQDLYNRAKRGLPVPRSLGEWKQLLEDLLQESGRVVILVDGLDESRSREDETLVLDYMQNILNKFPQVHFLCSSRQHVRVGEYFKNDMYTVTVTPDLTSKDIIEFVNDEIVHRMSFLENKTPKSIFTRPEGVYLLQEMRDELAARAKGMFRWVEIWLDILLQTPEVYNPQKTIQRKETAEKRLTELKTTASHSAAANEQLEAGYQLLWNFNEYEDFDEIRTNLFRIILCSFIPLSLTTLTETLRLRLDEDGSYDEALACEQIAPLYANFLTTNTRGSLGFAHDTARSFVLNMQAKAKAAVDSKQSATLEEIERDNHIYVANLYIQVMKLPLHGIWARSGYDLQRLREFNGNHAIPAEVDRPICLKDLTLKWERQGDLSGPYQMFYGREEAKDVSILLYLASFGLRHCQAVARKTSIFDERWAEVLDKLVLCSSPAFAFTVEATSWTCFAILNSSLPRAFTPYPGLDARGGLSPMFEVRGGQLELRHSRVLAALNIVSQDDFSQLQLEHLASNRPIPDSPDQRLLLLLQHANAPDILESAAILGNSAAVAFFLYGTYYLHGRQAALDLLAMKEDGQRTYFEAPFSIASRYGNADMLETMLDIEIRCCQTAGEDHPTVPSSGNRIAQQWSLPFGLGIRSGEMVLHRVARHFDENIITRLFSIGRPPDVNLQGRFTSTTTVLHYAAGRGFLQLTKDLVERYGADVLSQDIHGYKPSFYAFCFRRDDIMDYLLKKDGQGVYSEELRYRTWQIEHLLKGPE